MCSPTSFIYKIFFLNYKRTSFTHGDKRIYYQRRYYRSDRVAYDPELERRPGEAHPAALRDFKPVIK